MYEEHMEFTSNSKLKKSKIIWVILYSMWFNEGGDEYIDQN